MEEQVEEIIRIVVIPLAIMVIGFLHERISLWSKGAQRGMNKFRAWLLLPDGELNNVSPCNIKQIGKLARKTSDELVDINELACFESYSGIGFDLCIAALTGDIISLFKVISNPEDINNLAIPHNIVLYLLIHILIITVVTLLISANNNMPPMLQDNQHADNNRWYEKIINNWRYPSSKPRTVVAVSLGLYALISSFTVLWNIL